MLKAEWFWPLRYLTMQRRYWHHSPCWYDSTSTAHWGHPYAGTQTEDQRNPILGFCQGCQGHSNGMRTSPADSLWERNRKITMNDNNDSTTSDFRALCIRVKVHMALLRSKFYNRTLRKGFVKGFPVSLSRHAISHSRKVISTCKFTQPWINETILGKYDICYSY